MSGSGTIHGLFRQQAADRPNAVAVRTGNVRVTYQELDAWSDIVASRLLEAGVVPGDAVAVAVERSHAYPAAVLGILKAGGAYVPLDLDYPAERRNYILTNSCATVILGAGSEFGCQLRQVPVPDPCDAPIDPGPLPQVDDREVAYVIYTSGSTGNPKGVLVEHRQVVALVVNDSRLQVLPGHRVAMLAPLAFDASTFELWSSLCRGGELIVFQRGWDSISKLGQQLREYRPDWLFLTTGLFHLLVEYDPAALDAVGRLFTGGDVLSPRHVEMAAARRTARIFAAYGPTETTTFASLHEVGPGGSLAAVPIGQPLEGVRMYVLDAVGQPVPRGEIGELYIGGSGVARGYLGAASLTARKFLADPFADHQSTRVYRTGDLAMVLPDGEFAFHGRADRQLKIRGFRVEPGEIEAHLTSHPKVSGAIVTAIKEVTGPKRLVAYVTAWHEKELPVTELRDWLGKRLPPHMMPSSFVLLDELPLDPNGKPDRSALPYPWERRAKMTGLPPYRAPGSGLEQTIAQAWADSLGLDMVGLDDDFFTIGGDSLLSVDVLARLRREGLEVSAMTFFRNPTVSDLAVAVRDAGNNR